MLKYPVFFVGHGSPMNAIENNIFTEGYKTISQNLSKPKAILCVSAHWESQGSKIAASPNLETIHDFYGFPNELFAVEYPAKGSIELANSIIEKLSKDKIELDNKRGLDHGAWSVLKHVYPNAEIPIAQLSIDRRLQLNEIYSLASKLKYLRANEILIITSGNIVHNLRALDWSDTFGGADWAISANEEIKRLIINNDLESLLNLNALSPEARFAINSGEHYIPLIYALALKEDDDKIEFFNDSYSYGGLSMTSLRISNF